MGSEMCIRDSADVRDRMRSESPAETENPWIKMASYLAEKAVDRINGAKG